MAFVPQTAMNALDPVQRLRTQMLEVLRERGGLRTAAAQERAAALFRMVGLDPARLGDYPHQFSGGMRQRASIALALALEPPLVIADEPVTALDVIVQRQVLDVLRDLQARLGLALLLVTHDIAVVAYACDRVAVMYAGRIVESGPAEAVLERPLHPYTMGLMHAFPDVHGEVSALVPIEGAPPSLRDPPPGCRFAPRCPFRVARCTEESPPLAARRGPSVACWRAGEAAPLRARRNATWSRRSLPCGGRAVSRGCPIAAENLSKTFRAHGRVVHAVRDVSFAVAAGEAVGIVGESGCGKTTTARMLLRLEEPTGGRISFEGNDVTGLRGRALRAFRSHAQLVFQNPFDALNPRFTIERTLRGTAAQFRHSARRARRPHRRGDAARAAHPGRRHGSRAGRTSSPAGSCSASCSPARSSRIRG